MYCIKKKASCLKKVKIVFLYILFGEVAEWLKAHAWKACKRETVSRVRILSLRHLLSTYN